MERRDITPEERDALHRFLKLELSLDDLLAQLHGMVKIEFLPTQRRLTSHFNLVEPPVLVAKVDIERAIAARKSRNISERELVRWATMLVMNDAYTWEEDDEEIADALHDLSFGGLEQDQFNRVGH